MLLYFAKVSLLCLLCSNVGCFLCSTDYLQRNTNRSRQGNCRSGKQDGAWTELSTPAVGELLTKLDGRVLLGFGAVNKASVKQ